MARIFPESDRSYWAVSDGFRASACDGGRPWGADQVSPKRQWAFARFELPPPGDSDVVAVHAETIDYRVIDALHEQGLAITRKR